MGIHPDADDERVRLMGGLQRIVAARVVGESSHARGVGESGYVAYDGAVAPSAV